VKLWRRRVIGREGRSELMRLLVVLWVGAMAMAGCPSPPPTPAFQVTLRLSPTPPLIGPTRLIIEVADVGGGAVRAAEVSVEGLPEEATNRSATMVMAMEENPGRYVVPGFDLNVGGPWMIAVTVTDSTGVSITRAFPISVYGGS
jgi:hypothetical protein